MKKFVLLTCYILLYSGGFYTGCLWMREQLIPPIEEPKKPCGYTVLDYNHVITCKGDTINYQWKKPIKL